MRTSLLASKDIPATMAGGARSAAALAWLGGALVWRGHYRPSSAIVSRIGRILVASAVLGVLLVVASRFRPAIEAPLHAVLDHGAKEIARVGVTGVGGLIYLALLFATRALTLAEVRGLVRRVWLALLGLGGLVATRRRR